jgi:hypothetical protein
MELRSLVIALLKKRKGIGIDLFGVLQIDDQENGHVRVLDQRDEDQSIEYGTEYTFKDVKEGVDFFLEIRQERQLGYDFDRQRDREMAKKEIEEDRIARMEKAQRRINLIEDDDLEFLGDANA